MSRPGSVVDSASILRIKSWMAAISPSRACIDEWVAQGLVSPTKRNSAVNTFTQAHVIAFRADACDREAETPDRNLD